MPIYLWQNKILTEDGKIAIDPACCCDNDCVPCINCMTVFGDTLYSGTHYAGIDGVPGVLDDCHVTYEMRMAALNTVSGDWPADPRLVIFLTIHRVKGYLFVRVTIEDDASNIKYRSMWDQITITETNPGPPCLMTALKNHGFTLYQYNDQDPDQQSISVSFYDNSLVCDHGQAVSALPELAGVIGLPSMGCSIKDNWPSIPSFPFKHMRLARNGDHLEVIEEDEWEVKLYHENCKYKVSAECLGSGDITVWVKSEACGNIGGRYDGEEIESVLSKYVVESSTLDPPIETPIEVAFFLED